MNFNLDIFYFAKNSKLNFRQGLLRLKFIKFMNQRVIASSKWKVIISLRIKFAG